CATLEPGRDPVSDLNVILRELANYPVPSGQRPLLERPQIVALNKIDIPDARELASFVTPELEARGYRVFHISTATREGLRPLSIALGELVTQHRTHASDDEQASPVISLKPKQRRGQGFTIETE